jgi:pentatricopeptide repeat protein
MSWWLVAGGWWLAQRPNLHVFSGLLSVLDKAHQPDKALHYFAEIERMGLTPNAHCFSALISALGTAGRVDDAERHFAQMARLDVVPDLHCFSALISALGTAGRVDNAERHFAQMARRGVVPNLHCFTALISGFAEAGRVDEAERWFGKITTMGRLTPDLFSYSALIKANQVAQRPEKAVELLQEMTRKVLASAALSLSLSCVSCVWARRVFQLPTLSSLCLCCAGRATRCGELQHGDQQPGQWHKPPPRHGAGARGVRPNGAAGRATRHHDLWRPHPRPRHHGRPRNSP